MSKVLKIKFNDFKRLVDGRRIYYFDTTDYIDLLFLFEGFIVKTTLMKEEIENTKRFFSDKMFYGAIRLDFRIPDSDENNAEMVISREKTPDFEIEDVQDEETKDTDIQKSGVEDG